MPRGRPVLLAEGFASSGLRRGSDRVTPAGEESVAGVHVSQRGADLAGGSPLHGRGAEPICRREGQTQPLGRYVAFSFKDSILVFVCAFLF